MSYELGLKTLKFSHSGLFIPTTQSLGLLPNVVLAGNKKPDFWHSEMFYFDYIQVEVL